MTDAVKAKIEKAIENAMAILGALAIGAIGGWMIAYTYWEPAWRAAAYTRAVKDFERKAVRDHAGAWDSDATGAPRFRWTACNQFGVKE